MLLPQRSHAQQQESVPISFQQVDRQTRSGIWLNCGSQLVGIHTDPVGNGNDGDYSYQLSPYYASDPSDWTGLAEDIPGERITFLTRWSASSGPDPNGEKSCDFKTLSPPTGDLNAYYTPLPNEPPTACFNYDEADDLLTITFDASCSTDEDGEVVSYDWDFGGDGTGGGGEQASFTYHEAGEYEVTLTVRDDDGDDDSVSEDVEVEGPAMRYELALSRFTETASKRQDDEATTVQVGDSVLVRIRVENTGELDLEEIGVTGGEAGITVPGEPEPALVFVRAERAMIEQLEPGETDSLLYIYEAVHEIEESTLSVESLSAQAVSDNGGRSAFQETIDGCTVGGKNGPLDLQADSDGCGRIIVAPAPLVVNSTGDDPLDDGIDPEEDGCSTGGSIMRDGEPETECTLRAALQVAAARSDSEIEILFDIPEDNAVHRIAPEGAAFDAVPGPITIKGPSADGTPVEIDGSGLDGGIGFELGSETGAVTVEALAFYGFPSTVLAVRGRGSVVTGSLFGSDWAESYTSTDPEVTDPLRNGGPALLITGDETSIGEGNLIIGSTIGIFVDGAWDVEIFGNDIGILESPHTEHGIELHNADGAIVGSFRAGNRINYNLEYGIRVDEATSGARIQNNEIIRSRMDGILVQQGAAGGDPVVIGGEKEGDGNTIERSIGAGIRVTGSGGSAGGAAALLIQGNMLKANEEIGIRLEGGSAVQIGGATGEPGTGAGNDIEDGIELDPGRSSWVQGNRIARLDPETGYSDESAVIHVGGTNNVIGGETPAEGNVIYGVPEPDPDEDNPNDEEDPSGFGIWDAGTTTTLQFNMVGTDGPLYTGVVLNGTGAQVIENTISGNSHVGLSVRSTATIEGNFIGVTPTGNGAMPNGGPGIEVFTQALIGGYKEGDECERPCNVISGNEGPGMFIRKEATGTVIQGNMIGIGADGLTAVGNGESGILVLADNVRIGGQNDIELGDCLGPCNIIAANGDDGIRNFESEELNRFDSQGNAITRASGVGGASGLVIEGNFIGTTIPGGGNTGTGNLGHGIALGALGSDNHVGNTGTGGNLISFNQRSGVIVYASSDPLIFSENWSGGVRNAIRGNRIHHNGSLSIDLYPNYVLPGGDGWTTLDMGDQDGGPNEMINWPYLLESVESTGGPLGMDLNILWTGDSNASPSRYLLDVYTTSACNGIIGQAENYLVTRELSFPTQLDYNMLKVNIPLIESMPYYIATLTDSEGNTSELSNCRRAGHQPQWAISTLEPEVRTLVNELLIRFRQGEGNTATHKSLEATDFIVLRSDTTPGGDLFEETAALTPKGQPVVPQSTQGAYWEVLAPEATASLYYDVCLDVTDVSATDEVLVLGRETETGGLWRPFDTRLETVEGIDYACTDGLTAMHLALGSGNEAVLAAPTLLTPANNATEVDVSTAFTWQPLSDAASYDFQVALDAGFTTLLHDESGIAGTEARASDLANGQRHFWRVRGVKSGGEAGPWSVPSRFTTTDMSVDVEDEVGVPEQFVLEANYPNPFNPQTTIGFAVPQASSVRLVVYDVLGREVARLVEGTLPAGRHEAMFEATQLPSGVYLYRLEAGGFVQTRRMLLLK